MNIDSVSTVGTTQRSPQVEGAQRPAATQGRSPVPAEQVQSAPAKTPQAESNRGENSPSRDDVDEAVNRLAKFVAPNQSDINFSVDESSGVRVVKIIDRNSNEVIRQMPSEEAVALAQALDKLQGLLIKDKA